LVKLVAVIGVSAAAAAVGLRFAGLSIWLPAHRDPPGQVRTALPAAPGSYIGLYQDEVPASYAGVTAFTEATGVKPGVVVYYSGWMEPFQLDFAMTVAEHGAVLLVQMDPTKISLSAVVAGEYDDYLNTYARAVRAYQRPVIFSFGHEMNGDWYRWGNRHTPAAVFVAAWRHIVTLFRAQGAGNVTWLWAVNVIHGTHDVASPGPWWPGKSYVTWVGIDGYYRSTSTTFASLFGPTIAAVRALTRDPILLSETAVAPAAGQPTKIANLFAGVRLYGLLGFVWFDAAHVEDWRLMSPEAVAAFRLDAKAYHVPGS
jgi:hypothetical protein